MSDAGNVDVPIARTLPFPHEIGEHHQGLFDVGVRRRSMDLVKVDIVGLEAAQRVVDGVREPASRGTALVRIVAHRMKRLGGEHDVVAPALQRPADPAYQSLPDYVLGQLTPALRAVLDAAAAAGAVRAEVDADELLLAALRLATPASDGDTAQARRMVALFVDGLRYRARAPAREPLAGG